MAKEEANKMIGAPQASSTGVFYSREMDCNKPVGSFFTQKHLTCARWFILQVHERNYEVIAEFLFEPHATTFLLALTNPAPKKT